MSLPEIKEAIEKLSLEERAELAKWLYDWRDDDWDKQIQRDVAAGKLDKLLAEVDADIAKGNLFPSP